MITMTTLLIIGCALAFGALVPCMVVILGAREMIRTMLLECPEFETVLAEQDWQSDNE